MTTVGQVIKSVGPKLVPFFKTVAIYFVLRSYNNNAPSIISALLKCLPVISLMLFVLLHGMSLGEEYRYSRRILLGLVCCCIGDAFLIWPEYFQVGMLFFVMGHFNYISAFGTEPLNLPVGLAMFTVSLTATLHLMPGLHGILLYAVPIYNLILSLMVWRAIARARLGGPGWTWSKLCSCIGGILFAVSDFIIGIHVFRYRMEYAPVAIMITYYSAQLGISLSVVDSALPRATQ